MFSHYRSARQAVDPQNSPLRTLHVPPTLVCDYTACAFFPQASLSSPPVQTIPHPSLPPLRTSFTLPRGSLGRASFPLRSTSSMLGASDDLPLSSRDPSAAPRYRTVSSARLRFFRSTPDFFPKDLFPYVYFPGQASSSLDFPSQQRRFA